MSVERRLLNWLRQRSLLSPALILVLVTIAAVVTLPGHAWRNAGFVMLNYALARSQEGSDPLKFSEAERLLRMATESKVDSGSSWQGLALAYVVQGRSEEAKEVLENSGSTKGDMLRWGMIERARQHYDRALFWNELVIQLEPEVGDAWYEIGLNHELKEDWAQAVAAYQNALSSTLEAVQTGDVYYRLGRLQFRKLSPPQPEQAMASIDAAIATDRFSRENLEIQTHYERGEILRSLGRLSEAASEYEWVVAHKPTYYSALVNLGVLYWQIDQDFAQASSTLIRAISLQPDTKWAYRALGQVYEQHGQTTGAIEMYQRVLALDPGDVLAREHLSYLSFGSDR